ncbi:MAG: glycosyltransferase [Thermodesulfovibrionia bacterium]|nr:glycosyltransferase [Thermodesulfovibrionia bacterium]
MTNKEEKAENKNRPLVSIITPSYNSGKYLEATIRDILDQDYSNIEYIVIDGGSTDESISIIKQYEKNITYWVSEPDEGISDAFNKGIKVSKGEIIGIHNAGDGYPDGAIEIAVKSLFENPDYDFVYGDMVYTDSAGKPEHVMKGERNYLDKINSTLPTLNHPTVFVRRNVYETCGLFDTSYKIAMDYEFFLRITHAGKKGRYIEKPLALMALGGISYSRFYDGYREVCNASIKYGYNPLKAYVRLFLKSMRGVIRVVLEFFGLNRIIKFLQRTFWNIEDYKFL